MRRVKKRILGIRSCLGKGPDGEGPGEGPWAETRRSVWPRWEGVGGAPRVRAKETNGVNGYRASEARPRDTLLCVPCKAQEGCWCSVRGQPDHSILRCFPDFLQRTDHCPTISAEHLLSTSALPSRAWVGHTFFLASVPSPGKCWQLLSNQVVRMTELIKSNT